MVTLLRLPPFIATYGMLWMVHGFTYWYMAGETIYGFPPGFRTLGSGYLLGIPVPVYLMAVCLAAGGVFMRYTTYGYEIYAIGANARGGAAVRRPRPRATESRLHAERRDGRTRGDRVSGAAQFGRSRHRRAADAAGDCRGADRRHVALRRRRQRSRARWSAPSF